MPLPHESRLRPPVVASYRHSSHRRHSCLACDVRIDLTSYRKDPRLQGLVTTELAKKRETEAVWQKLTFHKLVFTIKTITNKNTAIRQKKNRIDREVPEVAAPDYSEASG